MPAKKKAVATTSKRVTKTAAPKKKPTPKKPAPKQGAATRKAAVATQAAARAPASEGAVEKLGEVTVPSGTLAVFDVGLVGYLPRPALEPALVKAAVPADRALPVVGRRVGKGRFTDCWDHVAVVLGEGDITHSKKLGEAGVDFARLVCMDHGALDHWQHEESLDGLADFIFWGRDAASLARMMRAPSTKEGYGWTNVTVADAEAKAVRADTIKAENHYLLATDFRPHSHHYYALAEARKNKRGAGTITVGGTEVCMFFTSWGDGVFPIFLDLDHDDHPVQVRVQLNTAESMAAMHAIHR